MESSKWQVPEYNVLELKAKTSKYCVCIPIINEGKRIQTQLKRMAQQEIHKIADIILLDAGSTDGSLEENFLKEVYVRTLLTKTGPGKQGAQLRMGFAYSLVQGYEGIITVDGNNKDSVESIPLFLQKLEEGWDMVQGSRYLEGGRGINTPFIRHWAVKLIHIPLISIASGFGYTDTTNAFRAYKAQVLEDARLNPFRDIFVRYELLAYLSVRIPRLGYKVCEVPVTRSYPQGQKAPTKISFIQGNSNLLITLFKTICGKFNP